MLPVAICSYASYASSREAERNEVEMLLPVIRDAVESVGLDTQDMGFTVSGSSDYLAGQPFAFVNALDAVGAWPPLSESHVEQDGAFALFEAVLRLQHGDIDTALVYGFGKTSPGELPRVLALQFEPYTMAPLFPDAIGVAGLQARAALDAGTITEEQMAEVVARSYADAKANPHAQRSGDLTVEDVLARPRKYDPLRTLDVCPISDGCAAMVLAVGDRALELTDNPVWISGMDHRIEAHALGNRDLSTSLSTRLAAQGAGVDGTYDIAEIHAPFSHQELLVRQALGLNGSTSINPSGGALTSNPVMATGLIRVGEAAKRLAAGEGQRAIAHATSGPALQQNLVATLTTDRSEVAA